MAAAKNNKKTVVSVDLPECPVCMETMTVPIFQCQSGHSLCNRCTQALQPPMCPICRQMMTQMRNWQLEDIVSRAKVPCPNKPSGCVYTMIAMDVEEHIKECIFRVMECPLTIYGRCSWTGKLNEMMEHFKERHPKECNISTDTEVNINNIDVKEDARQVYLVAQAKLLFIITIKMDPFMKMAYWTIQHIGSKKVAMQHVYEIHVTSQQNPRRKIVFIEQCFNDALKADDVFRQGKCAMLPSDMLNHFIKDKRLQFRFFLKRIPPTVAKQNSTKDDSKRGDDKNDNKPNKGPKGPKPGPKGPGKKPNAAVA